MASSVEVVQKACVLVGIAPITSFTDGTAESDAANLLYQDLADSALSLHPWSFNTRLVDITANRISTAPIAIWDAAYQLPLDKEMLTVHTILVDDFIVQYDRYEDDIYVNASLDSVVTAKVGLRLDENAWPPYFLQFMIYRVALTLALAVTRNETMIKSMQLLESTELERARTRDSQSRTARKANLKRFRNRRF